MIGKNINVQGASLVDVFIPRATPEESEKQFKEWSGKIMDEYYPVLTGYLTLQKVSERAHACNTIAELEALRWNQVPPDLFEKLAAMVNEIKTTDQERLFILIQCGDKIVFSATDYVTKILHQRAKVISNPPKNRIIV